MINVKINLDNKTKTIEVNKFESIYSLKSIISEIYKIEISNFDLYHQCEILKDNTPIYKRIKNNQIIHVHNKLKGGRIDILSLIFTFFYILILLAFVLILLMGFLPLIGYVYSYLLEWSLNYVAKLFNFDNNYWYKIFIWILTFILQIGTAYYFVYASSTMILFPLVYMWKDSICSTILSSNRIGYIMAVTFIIVYALFNIPNGFLNLTQDAANVSVYGRLLFQPITKILTQIANEGKFAPLYAIPFVGTPFLSGYHTIIQLLANAGVLGIEKLGTYKTTPEGLQTIGNIAREYSANPLKYPVLNAFLKRAGLTNAIKLAPIYLIPEIRNKYECAISNMPFWKKYFSNIGASYYSSKMAVAGITFALELIHVISNIVENIGGPMVIANIIKTGNIAGFFTTIALIISLFLFIFGVV